MCVYVRVYIYVYIIIVYIYVNVYARYLRACVREREICVCGYACL